MEKNRTIWNSSRSILGLIFFITAFLFPVEAKEIFDIPLKCCAGNFNFSPIQTVSFYFLGNEAIDFDGIIESISQGKANVITNGEKGLEGKALSSNLFVDVMLRKKQKTWLVTIDAYVNGVAKEAMNKEEKPFAGSISVASQIFVFEDSAQSKEVEKAISNYLQEFVNTITSTTEKKPTFFIIH